MRSIGIGRSGWKKIRDSLLYSFHVIFHPFDGFWCAQREGKGDVRAASIIIAVVTAVSILSRDLTGFIFRTSLTDDNNLAADLLSVILPVLLWCVANWSVTTLMDGEGSFKDIYIATAYALVPQVLVDIPMLLLSQVLVREEGRIYQALAMLGIVWTGLLLFTGLMTIHQHSFFKTLTTVLIAVVAMAAILFLVLLLFALIQQLVNFLYVFYKEIDLRF